jgi:hypothetical protein
MSFRYILFLCLIAGLLFFSTPVFSQTNNEVPFPESEVSAESTDENLSAADDQPDQEALPRTFRELTLGMPLEELKDALIRDSLFSFRGDRDVSFLPIQEQTIIDTTGFSFIRRAFFQLEEGNLFIMSFTLDPALIDHYSIFTQFVEKYGEPNSLNPQAAVWENNMSRISLERPLTVKYIDKVVFDELIEQSNAVEASELELRRDFLNDF